METSTHYYLAYAFCSTPISEASQEEPVFMWKSLQIVLTEFTQWRLKSSIYCHRLVWLHLVFITMKSKLASSVTRNCLLRGKSPGDSETDCPSANAAQQINPVTFTACPRHATFGKVRQAEPQEAVLREWEIVYELIWTPPLHSPETGETLWVMAKSHLLFGDIVHPVHRVTRKKSETKLCPDRSKQIKDL